MMLFGRYTPVMLAVCLLMTGLAGAAVGATTAANGGEHVDMYDRLYDETFTADGEFRDTEPPETPQAAVGERLEERLDAVFPETPRQDQWVREHIAKPMVLGAFRVADVGFGVGYAMGSTLGVTATRVLLNGAALATVVGSIGYAAWVVRGVAR